VACDATLMEYRLDAEAPAESLASTRPEDLRNSDLPWLLSYAFHQSTLRSSTRRSRTLRPCMFRPDDVLGTNDAGRQWHFPLFTFSAMTPYLSYSEGNFPEICLPRAGFSRALILESNDISFSNFCAVDSFYQSVEIRSPTHSFISVSPPTIKMISRHVTIACPSSRTFKLISSPLLSLLRSCSIFLYLPLLL
jgi:hypothetical protein